MNHAKTLKPGAPATKVLNVLRDAGSRGATSLEIQERAVVVAPSTVISQLRHMGYGIRRMFERVSESGAKVHRYWLVETT